MDSYEKLVNNELIQAGFDPTELTDEQRYLIMEPMEAPENYYCDGEITSEEADRFWIRRINNCGLSKQQVTKARKLNDL